MKTDDPLRKFAFAGASLQLVPPTAILTCLNKLFAGASLQLVPPTTIITRFNKLAFTKHEVKSLAQEKSE